jgi:hypothetical protein
MHEVAERGTDIVAADQDDRMLCVACDGLEVGKQMIIGCAYSIGYRRHDVQAFELCGDRVEHAFNVAMHHEVGTRRLRFLCFWTRG